MTTSTLTTRLGPVALMLAGCSNITPPNQTLTMGSTTTADDVSEGPATFTIGTESNTTEWETGPSDTTDASDWDEPDLPPGDECPPNCDGGTIANLVPVHILADDIHNLLYATVRGDAPEYPNELVVVDPVTAEIIDSVFVGSNPGSMALSDDGSTLWVGVDGSHEVARVDVDAIPPIVEDTYFLPTDRWGDLTYAGPMVVLRGTTDSVAISMHRENVSPSFAGVTILDGGVPRLEMTPGHTGASRLTGGPDGWLYGYNNLHTGYGFYAIEVLGSGPAQTEHNDLADGFDTDIVYSDGFVYATSGHVIDVANPSQPIPAGQFLYRGLLIPQPEQQRLLMLTPPDFDNPNATLRTLDPMTFTQIDSMPLDFGEFENFRDFTTADGQILAVIAQGWDFDSASQLVLFDNPF